jgi:hypothetical protein
MPLDLVVKNASNMRARCCGSMPVPLSRTDTSSVPLFRRAEVITNSFGRPTTGRNASILLITRFNTTCCNSTRSAITMGSRSASRVVSATCSREISWVANATTSRMISLMSSADRDGVVFAENELLLGLAECQFGPSSLGDVATHGCKCESAAGVPATCGIDKHRVAGKR